MKNTRNIIAIILCIVALNGKAQNNYIIAGQHGGIYYDIVPDTLLPPSEPYPGSDPSYSIDINQDGINDIKIDHGSYGGETFETGYVGVTALDSNTSFSYNGQHTTGNCGNVSLLEAFYAGDTIQNTTSYIPSGYVTYNYEFNPPFGAGACNSGGNWGATGDAYIGIKYQTNTSITYGWIKVNLSGNILIKEYSLDGFATGIKQMTGNNEQIKFYPNPVIGNLWVSITGSHNSIQEISLYDILGNQVVSTKEKNIDVSTLKNGVYFVRVQTNNELVSKKIIIQH